MKNETCRELPLISSSGEVYSASGICRLLHTLVKYTVKCVDNTPRVCKNTNDTPGATQLNEQQIPKSDPA